MYIDFIAGQNNYAPNAPGRPPIRLENKSDTLLSKGPAIMWAENKRGK